MPESLAPASVAELQEALRRCGDAQRSLEVGGAFSKRLMGGCIAEAAYRLETRRLNRLLAYEPADLTISVETGMRYSELSRILAENNQFLPLDPPYADAATIGGILATNTSGPRRRRYGTARDMTIGMRFATLEGKLVSSGGMVVKNVTGLDMGKLMIGSFGTLAVIASANFKVFPRPAAAQWFCFRAARVKDLLDARRSILRGALQPSAVDWLNASAATNCDLPAAHALVVEASGSGAANQRYAAAFQAIAVRAKVEVEPLADDSWERVREAAPAWLRARPGGAAIRVPAAPSRLEGLLALADQFACGAVLRAGNAVGHLLAPDADACKAVWAALRAQGFRCVVESASETVKHDLPQWDAAGSELEVMLRIKADFDPLHLLNRGRLYGAI